MIETLRGFSEEAGKAEFVFVLPKGESDFVGHCKYSFIACIAHLLLSGI